MILSAGQLRLALMNLIVGIEMNVSKQEALKAGTFSGDGKGRRGRGAVVLAWPKALVVLKIVSGKNINIKRSMGSALLKSLGAHGRLKCGIAVDARIPDMHIVLSPNLTGKSLFFGHLYRHGERIA